MRRLAYDFALDWAVFKHVFPGLDEDAITLDAYNDLVNAARAIGAVMTPTTETQHILNDRQRQREEEMVRLTTIIPTPIDNG